MIFYVTHFCGVYFSFYKNYVKFVIYKIFKLKCLYKISYAAEVFFMLKFFSNVPVSTNLKSLLANKIFVNIFYFTYFLHAPRFDESYFYFHSPHPNFTPSFSTSQKWLLTEKYFFFAGVGIGDEQRFDFFPTHTSWFCRLPKRE